MAKRGSSEKNKKIILAAAGLLFVFVLVYQFFISPPARPTRKPRNGNAPVETARPSPTTAAVTQPAKQQQAPKPGSVAEQEALLQQQLSDLTPLNLSLISSGGANTKIGERGNIFAYYVPPPPPPVKPPDPPPITLQAVTPASAVAGTPRPVTVTITGQKLPEDPVIFFDGRAKATKRINESQLTTVMEPADYSSARTINVEVKSQSDPVKNNSNTISITISPAPEPQFRYVGRLSEYALIEISAGNKEYKRLARGGIIQGIWRIDSITDTGIEVTHTQYEIKRRV
ncbi:MAG TPA: IPT/TIG domain-containing protein, partial [Blastocatellia bacterium]